jgi:hypothetical protein
MFEELKRRTLDLLAEKAANYPFDGFDDDEEDEEETKERLEKEEYDPTEGIAKLGLSNGKLMGTLNSIFEQEFDEQNDGEMNGIGSAELLGNGNWDEKLVQLQKCRKKMRELVEKRDKCNQV